MTRDERQTDLVSKWINNKGIGTIVASTGFGKTRIGCMVIKGLYERLNRIIVCVPSEFLKNQWISILHSQGFTKCEVMIINTLIKDPPKCDLLILDEIHQYFAETFSKVFESEYKYILGLTATIERADGKHKTVSKYCPILDEVTLAECQEGGYLAEFKEYNVFFEVPPDELLKYKKLSQDFNDHLSFFDYDFELAMSCLKTNNCKALAAKIGADPNLIYIKATRFLRAMSKRRKYSEDHEIKIQACKEIIKNRQGFKIITFSATTATAKRLAKEIPRSAYYDSTLSKKQKEKVMKDYIDGNIDIIHSAKALNTGVDLPGLQIGIIVSGNSSKITRTQSTGRVIRKEKDKEAEMFRLVLKGTNDETWNKKASVGRPVIDINEKKLTQVLLNPPVKYVRDEESNS